MKMKAKRIALFIAVGIIAASALTYIVLKSIQWYDYNSLVQETEERALRDIIRLKDKIEDQYKFFDDWTATIGYAFEEEASPDNIKQARYDLSYIEETLKDAHDLVDALNTLN